MKITDDAIKKICSSSTYKSGLEYFREGRVHIRVRDKNRIVSAVDSDKLYNVHIAFDDEGNITDTFCSCPYYQTMGSNCKHIVATLKTRQEELEKGEGFADDNDRVAQNLCREFEKQSEEKQFLHIGFIFNITTNHKRACSYSMSIKLGSSDTPIAGIESFLDAYINNKEYKLSKHKVYENSMFTFGSYEEHILMILAEAYQNKAESSPLYTPKLCRTDFGCFTAKRLMPLLHNIDCRFVINGMPYSNLRIKDDDPDVMIDVSATDDNINISIPQSGLAIIPDGSWFLYDGDIYNTSFKWRSWFMPLYNALSSEIRTQIDFRGNNSIGFAANILPHLKNQRGVVTQGIENTVIDGKPRFDVYFDRYGDGISAVIVCRYGNISIRLPSDNSCHEEKIIVRDYKAEQFLLSYFSNFEVAGQTLYLSDNDTLYRFLSESLAKISKLAELHLSESFKNLRVSAPLNIKSMVTYKSGVDLLEVGFETDISPAEISGILNALRHKKKYYRMKNGAFLDIDDNLSSFNILNNLDFSPQEVKSGRKTVSKYNALYLSGLVRSGKINSDSGFDALIAEIQNIRAEIPGYLANVLRDYQKIGVNWLKQLSELGFGGILADDMGLGKTLEVIAFIMSEKPQLPTLVITPSSLTYNWLSEINRFASSASARIIDGTKQERVSALKQAAEYDFIITSYPLLRRDIQEYKQLNFSYCFLDEAQHIKNPKTQSAKSVKQIRAARCFALSGTPIENSLTELWSIFDFVMPGYMLSHAQFAERYEKPISRDNDEAAAAQLRSKIKPFILRRMKYDVLSELPEKIENTFFAELEPSQKKLYSAYLAIARREAGNLVEQGDSMRILSLLMRLRQICCHPKLIDEDYTKESGKLNLLCDLVTTGIAAGHRILIFSQFTSMLTIIQSRLSTLGIDCFYLDGQTRAHSRTEMADRFNKGERSVFLVSLKAGGTGLNLIGADMVIHYDPWWNPAVTDQASDRAYRIGQTKVVHIIKLASKGTIEEQILKLQDKKRSLADGVIRANSAMLSNLSKEEILNLFN
ncbi:MAG: DEAD/DEAH box helicase [Firmicutes bacterium]|nr:DEAD/DEAH box helicase [Bacillota bacterium]